MKMIKIAAVSLLVALSITVFFGVANAEHKPLLDIDGDEIQTGVEYYVVSAISLAGGGGLALGRTSKQKCPEVVVQRRYGDYGTPVIFSNADSSDHVVRESTDVNIEFVAIRDRLCLTSTVWKVDDYDKLTGKWWVTTDGVTGNPGPNTVNNWFKIEKIGALGYKLGFCPTVVCESCKSLLCSDIGKYSDDGKVRLALITDEKTIAWPWVFIKKSSTIKQVVDANE